MYTYIVGSGLCVDGSWTHVWYSNYTTHQNGTTNRQLSCILVMSLVMSLFVSMFSHTSLLSLLAIKDCVNCTGQSPPSPILLFPESL